MQSGLGIPTSVLQSRDNHSPPSSNIIFLTDITAIVPPSGCSHANKSGSQDEEIKCSFFDVVKRIASSVDCV
jgi:hypothetical protein